MSMIEGCALSFARTAAGLGSRGGMSLTSTSPAMTRLHRRSVWLRQRKCAWAYLGRSADRPRCRGPFAPRRYGD
jgi:hypothetical protein